MSIEDEARRDSQAGNRKITGFNSDAERTRYGNAYLSEDARQMRNRIDDSLFKRDFRLPPPARKEVEKVKSPADKEKERKEAEKHWALIEKYKKEFVENGYKRKPENDLALNSPKKLKSNRPSFIKIFLIVLIIVILYFALFSRVRIF